MAKRYEDPEMMAYILEAQKAKLEWEAAENFFDNIDDPDLIDYAIYDMEAAKRKYVYLMKKARLKMPVSDSIKR